MLDVLSLCSPLKVWVFFRCVRYHSALKSPKKFIFWEAKLLRLKCKNQWFFLKISSYISKSIRFSGHYFYFHFRALWRYQLKIFVGGVLYIYTITHYILPVFFWIICKHKRREAEWQNKNIIVKPFSQKSVPQQTNS